MPARRLKDADYKPRLQARPPKLPKAPVVRALGPEFAGGRRPATVVFGPGEAPPGFVGPTTSRSEWVCYWALAKIENDPVDPRTPPFFGGRNWSYQRAVLGDWLRAPGSAILDFLYYTNRGRIGIRIQTRYFHVAQPPQQKAFDRLQRARLEQNGIRVSDVYEDDFIDDPSGRAAILVLKEAIGLRERLDPIASQRSLARG